MVAAIPMMKTPRFLKIVLSAVAGFYFCAPLASQTMDLIGVTALRSVATNLNGAGISVAQPEAPYTTLFRSAYAVSQ